MSAEPIETAHLPNFIQEAAGKLQRYVSSGGALAKSELQRLMADLHGLVGQLPPEAGEAEHKAMSFEARVAEAVRAAHPEVEAFLAQAKERFADVVAAHEETAAKLAAKTAEVEALQAQIATLKAPVVIRSMESGPALVIDATVSGEAKPLPQLDVTQSTSVQAEPVPGLVAADPTKPVIDGGAPV